nr:reverse transcriptase domain-containing protein [Tanacetum cinerariifolium]
MASTSFAHIRKQVLIEELKEKSIDEREVLAIVEEEGRTWMTPIYEYLTEEILPEEKRKARVIRRKAGFATQVSIHETSSTGATKQAIWKREASSGLSGKDHMRSRKH